MSIEGPVEEQEREAVESLALDIDDRTDYVATVNFQFIDVGMFMYFTADLGST